MLGIILFCVGLSVSGGSFAAEGPSFAQRYQDCGLANEGTYQGVLELPEAAALRARHTLAPFAFFPQECQDFSEAAEAFFAASGLGEIDAQLSSDAALYRLLHGYPALQHSSIRLLFSALASQVPEADSSALPRLAGEISLGVMVGRSCSSCGEGGWISYHGGERCPTCLAAAGIPGPVAYADLAGNNNDIGV